MGIEDEGSDHETWEVVEVMGDVLQDGLARYHDVHRLENGMNYVLKDEMVVGNLCRCPIV